MTRTDTRDFIISSVTEALAYDDVARAGTLTITEDSEIIFTDSDTGRVRKVTIIVE